jgi:PQQ-like domain
VYVSAANDHVIALQVEDGSIVWERRLGGLPNDVLALDDRVYVGSADNYLYCLKADEGTIDWRWPTGADVVGAPVADADTIYFTSLDNVLRALHRSRGNQRWKRALPIRPKTGPQKLGDILTVSGIAPVLRAYLLKDGAPAGEVATDGELAAAPYILPDAEVPTVIVVTRNIEKGDLLTAIIRASEPAPVRAADPKAPPAQKP